jgi:hypothetical protein
MSDSTEKIIEERAKVLEKEQSEAEGKEKKEEKAKPAKPELQKVEVSDASSLLDAIVLDSITSKTEVEIKSKGIKIPVEVGIFAAIKDQFMMNKKIEKREKLFVIYQGKYPIIVEPALVANHKDKFPDLTDSSEAPGKVEIYITDKAEIRMATIMECCLVKPKLSWGEAVVMARTNAEFVNGVIGHFVKINHYDVEEEAKNS